MRLLITGSRKNTNTIGTFITRNFDNTVEWELLTYPDYFAELLSKWYNKILYRVLPGFIIQKTDKMFLKQVLEFRPAIVVIFKGMEISSRPLKVISGMGIKLVNYNFDHPYMFFSRGTGNRFVREAIPYYDLHISYSSFIAKDLHAKYHVKTAWIPFGFHLEQNGFDEVVSRNAPEISKVCFVGNPDSLRVDMIRKLVAEGVPVDLYGFGWERIFTNDVLLTVHLPRKGGAFWSDPLEFWQILRQYRVQLNFFRPHNEGSHNLRTFEVPAVGGILLTPKSKEQADFFNVGEEIFFYESTNDLIQQCKWLLAQEKAFIDGKRQNARRKSVEADYSYRRRTADLLILLQNEVSE